MKKASMLPFESFWDNGQAWVVAVVLFGLALFKSGVAFEVAAQSPDLAFPLPEPGMAPTSFGMPLVVTVSGLEGNTIGIGLMMFLLTVIMLLVFALGLLRKDRSAGLIVTCLTLLGPIGVVALGNVGRNDWFLLAGSLVFALKGDRLPWALAAATLMVLGNPEQAFIALTVFLLLTFTPQFRQFRRSVLWSLLFVAVTAVVLALWVEALGLNSRASWIEYHLGFGLKNFTLNLPLSIYAGYGVGWAVVAVFIWKSKGKARALAVAALILIPFAVTATTADQTRVFVGVTTLISVVLYRWAAPGITVWLERILAQRWRTVWVLVLVLAPAIEITYAGAVRTPYEWIYEFMTTRAVTGSA